MMDIESLGDEGSGADTPPEKDKRKGKQSKAKKADKSQF